VNRPHHPKWSRPVRADKVSVRNTAHEILCQQIRAVSRRIAPRNSESIPIRNAPISSRGPILLSSRELAVSPKAGGFPPLSVTLAKKSPEGFRGCALPAVSRLVAQRKLGFRCGVNSGFRFCALLWRDQSKESGVVFVAGNQSLAELTFQAV